MMLNPQWLRTFTKLATIGSFTRTAEQLDLTQAAVSQHIRQLEARTGTLFLRRSRNLELTPAGIALMDYCAGLERLDQQFAARLEGADAAVGEVRLITPGSVGLYIYPRLLDLQVAYPGLAIRHRFAPDTEVLEAVLGNRYELGLVTLKPDDPRLAAHAFIEEPLELVIPAGARCESWADLERLGFIDHPDGQAMAGRLLSRHFPDAPGIRAVPMHGFSNQIGLILEPIARGLGFTVLPRHARQAFRLPAAISVVPSLSPVVDTLWLIHRAEWPLSARAQRALDYLRDAAPGLLSAAPGG